MKTEIEKIDLHLPANQFYEKYGRKKILGTFTLGCKVNQYETQALKEKFMKAGYEVAEENEFADVYVINTCTVTSLSDKKSRQYIRRVKRINPESITAVVGCYAQVSPDEAAAIEGVNLVAGTNEKNNLIEYIEAYLSKRVNGTNKDDFCETEKHILALEELTEYENTGVITSMDSRVRAYIKVQEGCNRFCSYCIIPYARGGVRSRPALDIVEEARNLIAQGFKEIVLTGINTALYGMENKDGNELYGIEIIVNKLNQLEGDFRIRIGSLEPTVINRDYAIRLLRYEKLCPHFHLSIQSGSDKIIEKMNRNYTRKEYLEIISVLREKDKCFGITTDIIVGFPGETEEDFRESLDIVTRSNFLKVHVFKYSKRKRTAAAMIKEHLSPNVKNRRSHSLSQWSDEVSKSFLQKNMGTTRTVLVETYDEETGYYQGHTENYVYVYVKPLEVEKKKGTDLLNQFVKVQLSALYKNGMIGIIS